MVNFDLIIQKEDAFALEITKGTVRVMKLTGDKSKMKMASFNEVSIPKSSVVGGVIRRKEIVTKAIKEAVEKAYPERIKTPYVITVLPDEKIFVRIVEFPYLPKDELKDALLLKIESLLAMPIANVYWDWHRIHSSKSENKILVLIAAVERDCADSFLETLNAAGLIPLDFEISGSSAARAIITDDELAKASHLFINLAETTSNFSLWSNGGIQFNSYTRTGRSQLQKIMLEKLPSDELLNKQFKFDIDKLEPDTRKKVEEQLDQIVDEIQKVLEYYEGKFDDQLKSIFIYGVGSEILGVKKYIEDKLSLKLIYANPKLNIFPKPQLVSHVKLYPHITLLGLALRGIKGFKEKSDINLLPEDTQKQYVTKNISNSVLRNLIRVAGNNIFLVFLLFVMIINVATHTSSINRAKDLLENTLFSKSYSDNTKSISTLKTDLDNYNKILSTQYNWTKVLGTVEESLPDDIELNTINISTKEEIVVEKKKVVAKKLDELNSNYYINIQGKSKSRDSLIKFYKALIASDYFINAKNPLVNYEQDPSAQNRYFKKLDDFTFVIETQIDLNKIVLEDFVSKKKTTTDTSTTK
ncbi:pilus assembly protein PilM [Candidatus Dojkabacteria bacterium]|uniref:Pilus assembly protein PilM n=1 Tax=Candidatus Dojkabacteria bacterium TaxID=2099670 RepID=A0A955RIA9_9BACT|nr:pilus assembly protein PilM [Candidatus Dojkabacteria bacterium]